MLRTGPLRPVAYLAAAAAILVAAACATPTQPAAERGVKAESSAPSSPLPRERPAPLPPTDPVPPSSGTVPRQALLIGIDHAHGAPPLGGAVGDVRLLERALLAYGFPEDRVMVLENADADRDRILGAIEELAATTAPDGRAVFAFAGHTRRTRGKNRLVAADGRTISADELARALNRVRTPMWVALPTCYAAGFRVPGIVGPGRVTTFASAADRPAYESIDLGRSFLVEYMVGRAMLSGRASGSVEQAFVHAHHGLERDFSRYVPLMDDRFPGPFVLGPPLEAQEAGGAGTPPHRNTTTGEPGQPSPTPTPEPEADPTGGLPCTPALGVGACEPS